MQSVATRRSCRFRRSALPASVGDVGPDLETAADARPGAHTATDDAGPLGHPGQPGPLPVQLQVRRVRARW